MHKIVATSLKAEKDTLKKNAPIILLHNADLIRDALGPNCYYQTSVLTSQNISYKKTASTSVWNTYRGKAIAGNVVEDLPINNM